MIAVDWTDRKMWGKEGAIYRLSTPHDTCMIPYVVVPIQNCQQAPGDSQPDMTCWSIYENIP